MSFPRYPAYKPSGVEWLGEVPEHWEALPLRRLIREVTSGTSVNAIDEPASPGQPGVLKTSCVYTGEFRPEENKAILESELDRATCPLVAGSLVVSRMNTPDLVGAAGLVKNNDPFLFLPDRLWQVRFQGCHPRFINHWCKSVSYRCQVQLACSGTSSSMQNLSQDSFYSFISPLPPALEQEAIATFLDRETAKIDALIAEQQCLIELLQEKRQAVISHAVTKGLNSDAPMKDSGVEWLGEVPEHWSVTPLRLAARIESGHAPSRAREDYWIEEECVFPWFTLGDVWQIREGRSYYVYETSEKVSQAGLDNSAARLLPANTVILSRTASVGFSGILGVPMATTQDFVNWICGPTILPEFLLYVFRAMSKEFERLKYGSTHNTIYMPDIFGFRAASPPVDEQRQIVAHLRASLQRQDHSLGDLLKCKKLLQERRSALISAAVTGQIDVRSLVPEAEAA